MALGALEKELESDDAQKIKSALQNVTEAATKLGQAIYESEMAEEKADDGDAPSGDDAEEVVDADFTDVDEDESADDKK